VPFSRPRQASPLSADRKRLDALLNASPDLPRDSQSTPALHAARSASAAAPLDAWV